jgi:hypothetical protein
MAYATSAIAPTSLAIPEKAPRPKRSLFHRMLDAIEAANMRRAQREVALYLSLYGGKFTDEAERAIERRLLSKF